MKLGEYELLAEIGRGGMGAVYRARAADGREVALKVLFQDDPEAAALFEREQRLLASLTLAEGFVPLLDSGREGEKRWVVMPLLRGGTLRDRLKRGPLEATEALALVRKLATALGRAHERGIVHRDMKPENVLLTEKGEPLVADLGLAKHYRRGVLGASESRSLSETGALIGTTGYMAPEQLEDPRNAGPASDVFALGVILHECLAGRRPFRGGVLEYVRALESPPERLPRGTPRWVEKTVARMLSREPGGRFADGHAVARALARPPRSGKTALAVALLLLLGAGSALFFKWEKPGPPPAPPRPAPRATPSPAPAPPPPAPPPLPGPRLAPGDAKLLLDRAGEEVQSGEFDQAIEDATRVLESEPELAEAWSLRAGARRMKRDYDGALADATRAIEIAPLTASVWAVRGTIRERTHDLAGADTDFSRALELDPRHAPTWADRAKVRLLMRNHSGGRADADKAIELDPSFALPWLIRGEARLGSGDFDGAVADATRAIERAPREMMPWRTRGIARIQLGENQAGIDDLTRALEIDPDDPPGLRFRGHGRAFMGDKAGARADFERYLALAQKSDEGAQEARDWLARNPR
jgi:serine/threonine-protein kinase